MAGIDHGNGVGRRHLLLAAGAAAASVFALALSTGLRETAAGSPEIAAGAVGFALIVGVPMAITAGGAVIGDRRAATAAVTSGLLLICWLLAEMTLLRTLDWLQPLYIILGIVVAGLGLHIKTEDIGS